MECKKCGQIVPEDNKFCSNCGSGIEVNPLSDLIHHDNSSKNWFILGFTRGVVSKDKKSKKIFEDFLKKKYPDIWPDYLEAVAYMKDLVNKNEKNKETIRSKRKGISKTKAVQKE